MTNTLNEVQLAQIVGAVLKALQTQGAAPKGAAPQAKTWTNSLEAKDRSLLNTFSRRGFKVTLLDRNDPTKPYDVRPYKGWLAMGRIVRRGERGVRGLFHESQTDPVPAKPEMTAERKGMFRKAAKKLQPVKA
jgi:hypothetical protein